MVRTSVDLIQILAFIIAPGGLFIIQESLKSHWNWNLNITYNL